MARIDAATLVWSIEAVSYVNIISRQVAMAFLRTNGGKREGEGTDQRVPPPKDIKGYSTEG